MCVFRHRILVETIKCNVVVSSILNGILTMLGKEWQKLKTPSMIIYSHGTIFKLAKLNSCSWIPIQKMLIYSRLGLLLTAENSVKNASYILYVCIYITLVKLIQQLLCAQQLLGLQLKPNSRTGCNRHTAKTNETRSYL